MAPLEQALRSVPSAVRQLVAIELLEAGQRAHDRAVAVDTDERFGGAVDLLAQQAHVYRTLARLLTAPPTAQTD